MNNKVSHSVSLIAPCGMNCCICLAYLRDKNKCMGCRSENKQKAPSRVKCIIKNCELLKATESKFCYECKKFPCTRLKNLDKRYRTKYNMSMLENLEKIKRLGLSTFVGDENKRWKCSSCGATICVHRALCLKCKQSVS